MTRLKKFLLSRYGILVKSVLAAFFPLSLIALASGSTSLGLYGEFMSQTSFIIPFLSLGQLNLFTIENRESPSLVKVPINFAVVLLFGLLIIPLHDILFVPGNVYIYWVYLGFFFINMMRNFHDTIERNNGMMILHELLLYVPSLIYILCSEEWNVMVVIYIRMYSTIASGIIFCMRYPKVWMNIKSLTSNDLSTGILFIPSKMLGSLLDYVAYRYTGGLSLEAQNEFFKYRKIAGVMVSLLELKNQMLLKFSYSQRSYMLLFTRWAYLDIFFLLIALVILVKS